MEVEEIVTNNVEIEMSKLFFIARRKDKSKGDIPSFNIVINGVGTKGWRIFEGRVTPPSVANTNFSIACLREDICKLVYDMLVAKIANLLEEAKGKMDDKEIEEIRDILALRTYEDAMVLCEMDKKTKAKLLG